MSMIKKEKTYRIAKIKDQTAVFQRERDLMTGVKCYLETRDDLFWRRIEGSGKAFTIGGKLTFISSDMKGFPDVLIVCEGMVFGVELKVFGGALTQAQAETICQMNAAGGGAGIALSVRGVQRLLGGEAPMAVLTTDFGEVGIWC